MQITSIADYRRAVRLGAHAWPGGYPLRAIMADGEILCCGCLKRNRREILTALVGAQVRPHDQWLPVCLDAHMEGRAETCSNCDATIESVYGDPEDDVEKADRVPVRLVAENTQKLYDLP